MLLNSAASIAASLRFFGMRIVIAVWSPSAKYYWISVSEGLLLRRLLYFIVSSAQMQIAIHAQYLHYTPLFKPFISHEHSSEHLPVQGHLALPALHGTLPLSKGRNAFLISFAFCAITESHSQNKPLRFEKPLLGAYRLSLGDSRNPCALGRFATSLFGSYQGASL